VILILVWLDVLFSLEIAYQYRIVPFFKIGYRKAILLQFFLLEF